MRPALWKAVATQLKFTNPEYRLTAVDDFNARISLQGSKARVRAFYQPREGEVPGEGTVSLTLNAQKEIGAITYFLSEQKRFAKKLRAPLHFTQRIEQGRKIDLGEADFTFKADIISWHDKDLIDRLSVFYADSAHTLFALHAEIITAG